VNPLRALAGRFLSAKTTPPSPPAWVEREVRVARSWLSLSADNGQRGRAMSLMEPHVLVWDIHLVDEAERHILLPRAHRGTGGASPLSPGMRLRLREAPAAKPAVWSLLPRRPILALLNK
jgi:hypothetical protein